MKSVKQLNEEIGTKRTELQSIFDGAKQEDGSFDLNADQLQEVHDRNDELNDLVDEREQAKAMDSIHQDNVAAIKQQRQPAKHLPLNGGGAPQQPSQQRSYKSLGQQVVEAERYKNWRRGQNIVITLDDFESKTLMTTSAGFAPENLRIDRVIESAQRRPMVDDFIPQTTTTMSAVVYMEETTFTNNAAEAAEGGTYSESALAYTEQSTSVRKIATSLPVTDEQMEDVPQIQSVVDNRLTLMIRQRRESQLLVGDGVSPNIEGFLNKSGVQTQAKGADPVPDAIYKGMTLVRHTGFADPTAVIMHPNDWQDVRLLRTTDGVYIWGSPSEAGPERIWGLPVVVTTAITENTALTGDFQLYSEIYFKKGITIAVTDSHGTFFVEGKQMIRADERLALAIYRAAAFCKVTGI